jgi:hypothetical protein
MVAHASGAQAAGSDLPAFAITALSFAQALVRGDAATAFEWLCPRLAARTSAPELIRSYEHDLTFGRRRRRSVLARGHAPPLSYEP